MTEQRNIQKEIEEFITNNGIILFMKGTSQFPMCGFSSQVVQILKELNIKFTSVNVLEDDEIRQGIKEFSNWPTIPQLYVNGEFIGGCDIVTEMYENGELEKLMNTST